MENEGKVPDKKLEWIPNRGLGDILIGSHIDKYQDSYQFIQSDKDYDNEYNRKTYFEPELGISLNTEDFIIVSIDVENKFYYKSNNIIGMKVKEVTKILGSEPEEKSGPYVFDNNYVVTSYDYLKLGLLLWVNDKKVVSITCSDSYV
jgi:hypothetical protein